MPAAKGFFTGSRLQVAAPARSLPQCGACGLFRKCQTPKLGVSGHGERRILFVGDVPGDKEDKEGTNRGGRTWQELRRVLSTLNFDLDEDGWYTNALICHTPKGRKPSSVEIGYCRPNMVRDIRIFKPTVIVPMGAAAVSAVLGGLWKEDVGPVERWVGWDIPSQELNAWICPTWLPAFLQREDDPVLDRQFREHLKRAVAHTEAPWPDGAPDWAGEVRRVTDPAKAASWIRKCAAMKEGAVAWDYETNMLKPDGDDARIVSCSVAWGRQEPERCIAFPWHGEVIPAIGELLKSPIPKIASNLKFEDRWTRKEFGHEVRGWAFDTMLAAHVHDNRPGITSVKFQAFVRLGMPLWNEKIEQFLKTKGDAKVNAIIREIDISDLLLYNGLDALLEFRVAVHQITDMGWPWPWRTS